MDLHFSRNRIISYRRYLELHNQLVAKLQLLDGEYFRTPRVAKYFIIRFQRQITMCRRIFIFCRCCAKSIITCLICCKGIPVLSAVIHRYCLFICCKRFCICVCYLERTCCCVICALHFEINCVTSLYTL